jgi:hypothetical protein
MRAYFPVLMVLFFSFLSNETRAGLFDDQFVVFVHEAELNLLLDLPDAAKKDRIRRMRTPVELAPFLLHWLKTTELQPKYRELVIDLYIEAREANAGLRGLIYDVTHFGLSDEKMLPMVQRIKRILYQTQGLRPEIQTLEADDKKRLMEIIVSDFRPNPPEQDTELTAVAAAKIGLLDEFSTQLLELAKKSRAAARALVYMTADSSGDRGLASLYADSVGNIESEVVILLRHRLATNRFSRFGFAVLEEHQLEALTKDILKIRSRKDSNKAVLAARRLFLDTEKLEALALKWATDPAHYVEASRYAASKLYVELLGENKGGPEVIRVILEERHITLNRAAKRWFRRRLNSIHGHYRTGAEIRTKLISALMEVDAKCDIGPAVRAIFRLASDPEEVRTIALAKLNGKLVTYTTRVAARVLLGLETGMCPEYIVQPTPEDDEE